MTQWSVDCIQVLVLKSQVPGYLVVVVMTSVDMYWDWVVILTCSDMFVTLLIELIESDRYCDPVLITRFY